MATRIEQLVDEISGLTALELAELAKVLEDKFGVSAMAPMMAPAAGAAAAAAPQEEKTEYKVELLEMGGDKIKAIKAVRQIKKDLGLTDAKKLVEDVPSVLAEAASKEEANNMKAVLEAAGCKVKLS